MLMSMTRETTSEGGRGKCKLELAPDPVILISGLGQTLCFFVSDICSFSGVSPDYSKSASDRSMECPAHVYDMILP